MGEIEEEIQSLWLSLNCYNTSNVKRWVPHYSLFNLVKLSKKQVENEVETQHVFSYYPRYLKISAAMFLLSTHQKREYKWILEEEVHNVLKDLHTVLTEACKNFPVHIIPGDDQVVKPEKFVLTSSNGAKHIKCMVTLHAENICEADFTLKLMKQQSTQFAKIYPDTPWRLSQIQDSANHLFHALSQVDDIDEEFQFHSGQEVMNIINRVTNSLQRGHDCIVLPKKKTLEEIINNPQLKCIRPHLPRDSVLSFYVQAQKIVLSVYQLFLNQSQKFDISQRYQVECTVPWLSDVLVFYTVALQLCQQLIDKLSVFKQYEPVLHPKILTSPSASASLCDMGQSIDASTSGSQEEDEVAVETL